MKAVLKTKDGKAGWEYKDVPRPEPKMDEVEIEVKAIGICGSEIHLYHDNHFYTPPVIVGHEFSGIVSRIGSNVTDYKVGDRVVAQMDKGACGKCEFCRKGMTNFCVRGKAVGYDIDGGWAEYYCTPEKYLLKLPENISYEVGTMAEPSNVVCQALYVRNTLKPGDVVFVQGGGTIGMLCAIYAKAMGASKIILSETNEGEIARLPIARKLKSVDRTVNIEKENLNQVIMEETDFRGADLIIECSGSEKGIAAMFDCLKKTGRVVVLGETAAKSVSLDWNNILVKKSCDITFSFGEIYEAWDIALRLMSLPQVEEDLNRMISHRLPLADFGKGFDLLEKKEGLKVILEP
ncbi:alcohol dehydrogenase catalytic domain-containing protein [Anaerovorax odorimutans]|uniref:Alcohol dehydrogenase catalytic domain-containing protein n=1 Tax=Anaerovorax odorimutans TaxID=109327 RepID=A0ABT1RQ17_9FIRM|nr:alcohol dehydrogenase catalytic domain-containing protein [Anaerovorax odorimutans]MCQ4636971.1 alcohol dehydrogenase catalytic domain-containing protein [Anaerovorax odorimutans]